MRRKWPGLGVVLVVVTAVAGTPSAARSAEGKGPLCRAGGPPVELRGDVTADDAKTYGLLPFTVAERVTRVEVGYSWADKAALPSTPLTQTVLDLGLWDEKGYRSTRGFRGWSGSRHGKLHGGQAPVFVQADRAERTYRAGPVMAGTWHVELGIAAVAPSGAEWLVRIACKSPKVGAPPKPDPVNERHVARRGPAWFHGDFHMHAFHSHPQGPTGNEFVASARAAKLDFFPVTEYVVGWHWDQLGATQRAHPDVLLWPGREIITYFGHANAIGETRGVIEYRHGFENVTLRDIQRRTKDDGALFQVNHPTIFPGPLFQNFCRGCEFTLGDAIDWRRVDTIEVLTGPVVATPHEADGRLPTTPVGIENPFVGPAIDLWEDLLRRGYRITAVSGSDSKGQEPGPTRGYGSSATAVFADELSRAALTRALRAGRAYVRTRGVDASPELDLIAVAPNGRRGTFGSTLRAESARVTVTVRRANGQLLEISRNGEPVAVQPITGDSFTHTFTATRAGDEGPLGTFWRVDTRDGQSLTTIANPVFLRGG